MSERRIAPVVRIVRARDLDETAERRAYWATRTIEERFLEVESLRRLWIDVTGDPDEPIRRVVQRRHVRR
jgi:hypothetical protein